MSDADEEAKKAATEAADAEQTEQEHAEAATELTAPAASGQLQMHVKVYSPFKEYFDGEAYSLTAENDTGVFDILPKHHNFISLLNPCDLHVRTTKGDEKIRISGGVMHVKADEVIVFLDV